MASRACVLSGGGSLRSGRGRATFCYRGGAVAIGSVPWNTSTSARQRVPWLPNATVPFLDASGRVTTAWYNFFHEIAEARLGGVAGVALPVVAADVSTTQTSLVAVIDNTNELNAYARSIDATATALKEVAVDNGQSGAGTVPDPTEPPPRATAGTAVA